MDNLKSIADDLNGLMLDEDIDGFDNVANDTVSDDADDLIKHIDDFKRKAAELKSLMVSHRNRAHELEKMVANKADESIRLDSEIETKKKESAAFSEAIKLHFGKLGEDIRSSMGSNLGKVNEDVKESLDEFEKKVSESIDNITEGQKTNKDEIMEKIHFESVQCYNNIKATIDESDEKMERLRVRLEAAEDASRAAGSVAKACLVFTIINTVGIAGAIVLSLINAGIIPNFIL